MAYFRQSYIFGSDARQNGSKLARWGDEAEAGAGLRFSGQLDGFFYGSLREMANVRYWGIGIGAISVTRSAAQRETNTTRHAMAVA